MQRCRQKRIRLQLNCSARLVPLPFNPLRKGVVKPVFGNLVLYIHLVPFLYEEDVLGLGERKKKSAQFYPPQLTLQNFISARPTKIPKRRIHRPCPMAV
jgi:hypothetical protein